MKESISLPERLVVALDLEPDPMRGIIGARDAVLSFASEIADTRVVVKVNSVLRACGYGLIGDLQNLGLRVFADLKLIDIEETLRRDGAFLRMIQPEIVTVMCQSHTKGMAALKQALPNTEVFGVTVLTNLDDDEVRDVTNFETTIDAVLRYGTLAINADIDGVIASPKEISDLLELNKTHEGNLSVNTPGIRPLWAQDKGDQKRTMTPAEAVGAGADRIVVGRPILKASNPRDAILRTLDEIGKALAA